MHQLAATLLSVCLQFVTRSVAMDLRSAHALLMVAKNNRVVDVMLTLYKDEAKAFGRDSCFRVNVPEREVFPANRCRMPRGGGRCRGATSELSIAQMCTYHQLRQTGDLNIDSVRQMSVLDPVLYRLTFGRERQ